MEKTFKITGMTCSGCAAKIENAMRKLEGIKQADVNFAAEKLYVSYDKLSEADIIMAIRKAGYNIPRRDKKPEKTQAQLLSGRFIISLILIVPMLIYSIGHRAGLPLAENIDPEYNPLNYALLQLILTIPIMLTGISFYISGIKSIIKLKPDRNSLIALCTLSAVGCGLYDVFMIIKGYSHYSTELYFESAAAILTIATLGMYLEALLKNKSSQALKELSSFIPPIATVRRGDKEFQVRSELVRIGDIVLVKPGERFPADGVVTKGSSYADESMITGRSNFAVKLIGSKVLGASLNGSSFIEYKAEKIGKDMALSQIIKLAEESQNKKAPVSEAAEKISSRLVFVVIALAAIAAAGWGIAGKPLNFCMNTFISVLAAACPAAFCLAAPGAITAAVGQGAKRGILIKGGDVIEKAHKVKTVIFNKNGTITEGKLSVADINAIGEINVYDMLSLCAIAEKHSEHPLGECIVKEAKLRDIELPEPESFEYIDGMGVKAVISGKSVLVGNKHLMKANSIDTRPISKIAEKYAKEGKTPVIFAAEGKAEGIIAIADKIKAASRNTVETLRKRRIKSVMITGDCRRTAATIAIHSGIKKVAADVLPADKADIVKTLQDEGKVTAMVGDGTNDAAALAQADVGIAIGTEADISAESADIVLINGSVEGVNDAIQLSRKTMRNIRQNLFWAFVYNLVCIPFAMGILHIFGGPVLNPVIAAAAASLSLLLAPANSLRLKKSK